ncbi:MAG: translocation/assembly module TamB domain-containing protein [Pseudomonadota bacterium]
MHSLHRLFALLVVLGLLAATPEGYAQDSAEDDPGFLERIIQNALGGDGRDVQIRGLEGPLSGEPRIAAITVSDSAGQWLEIRDVALNWQRLAAFRGRLEVNSLTIGEVTLTRAPEPPPTTLPSPEAEQPEEEAEDTSGGFALPELPVSVRVGALAVGAVNLGEALIGQAASLSVNGSASLAEGEGDVTLQLVRLDGTPGLFDLQAGFVNETGNLTTELKVQEAAGGLIATLAQFPGTPSLSLTVSGDDPISDFAAQIALRTDDQDRLSGEVRLTQAPAPQADATTPPVVEQIVDVKLGGDITALFLPEYRPFFGDAVALDLRGLLNPEEGVTIETLNITAAALNLTGNAELSPSFAPLLLDLNGSVERSSGLPVILPLPGPATLIQDAEFDIAYNAADSDAVTLTADLRNLQREDGILLDQARITADGTIELTETNGLASASADIEAALDGLSVTDPELIDAAGESASLTATVDWQAEGTARLSNMVLTSEAVRLTGDADVSGLAGEQAAPEVSLNAALESGPLDRFAALAGMPLQGEINADVTASYATADGSFDVVLDGNGQDLAIGQEQADALLTGPLTLMLSANRSATGIDLRDLSLSTDTVELTGGGTLASAGGDLGLDARIDELAVLGLENLSGPLTLSAVLKGSDDIWDATVDLASELANIDGSGKIQNLFGGPLSVDGGADIELEDLSRYAALAGMPLTGSLRLNADGKFDSDTGDGAVQASGRGTGLSIGQPQADALLAGVLALQLDAARTGDEIALNQLDLRSDALTLTGGGNISGANGSLEIEGRVPELSVLDLSGLSGPLTLAVNTDGQDDVWDTKLSLISQDTRVIATADLKGLMAGEISVTGNADIETGNLERFATVAGLPLTGSLTLSADGAYDTATGDGNVAATGSGSGISTGIAQADALLAGPLALKLDAGRKDGDISVKTLNLSTDALKLAGDGGMQSGQGRFDLSAEIVDLSRLVEGISGPLALRAAVEGADQNWDIAGNLQGPSGLTAVVQGAAIQPDGTVDIAITGEVPLLIADPFITPRSIVGDAAVDLALKGAPGIEALSGSVTINGARFSDPATRLVLENIALQLGVADQSANIDLTSELSTGGQITVSGPVALTPPFNAEIAAALNALTLLDPTLYEINLNGEASVRGPLVPPEGAEGAAITSVINVTRAELKIPAGIGGPGALTNVQHVDEPQASLITRERAGLATSPPEEDPAANGSGPVYPLDITVNAFREIFVRGRGLDVEMGGEIKVGGSTAAPVPTGGIRLLRGQFALLGQRLEFERAEVSLQGDLVPNLDMVAYSDSGDVRSQIMIEGPINAPEISFSSEPELPQDEVLAQLFFGKPINELTPLEVAQLVASVNRLTGGGGNGVLGNLREGLGIDSLGVSTAEDGTTEVSAGKYITEKLYTDVTVGADGTSEIELNYDFNSTFKGRTAFDSEGDSSLGFVFERDY